MIINEGAMNIHKEVKQFSSKERKTIKLDISILGKKLYLDYQLVDRLALSALGESLKPEKII